MQVGASKSTRNAVVDALFGRDGVANVESSLVDDALRTVRELCCTLPSAATYIETRIVPLLNENRSANRINWTNNNAESMNHVLK